MSIKTNHASESITPTVTGVLTVRASGALGLPFGPSIDRPLNSVAGYIRYASDLTLPEYYDGTNWQLLTNKLYVDTKIANITLDSLVDVESASPTDSQVIAYDATLGRFTTQTHALNVIVRQFVADGVSANFDIVTNVNTVQSLIVSINGIEQQPSYSYTLVDNHIVSFDGLPESGDIVQVKILKSTTSTDRPRPRITQISYSTISSFTTITIVATDITYGTGVKIGNRPVTRIDFLTPSTMQLMIETDRMEDSFWNNPQDLTLVDTSGNEFVYTSLINYGSSKPYWTNSVTYIGTFSGGDTINFALGVNSATSLTLSPAYAGENILPWLSISNEKIVGTAPRNSSPSRYEVQVTATNGSVNITKNYWLMVI